MIEVIFLLEIKGLTKYYNTHRGIENLSLSLDRSEVLGIIGHNGSGKTTTFRILLNLLKADFGTITFNGQSIVHNKRLFGYLPEERSLYKDLSVESQLTFFGKLKGMSDDKIQQQIDHWLQRLSISHYRHHLVKSLSKGNQQKVQLICAVLHDPSIIILDEPFSGLDVENSKLLSHVITELKQQQKLILVSSHQHNFIESFVDKILVLKQGLKTHYDYLSVLKRQSPLRYVTTTPLPLNFYSYPGVDDVSYFGHHVRITFSSEAFAKEFSSMLLNEYDIDYLKVELPSLSDILRGTL